MGGAPTDSNGRIIPASVYRIGVNQQPSWLAINTLSGTTRLRPTTFPGNSNDSRNHSFHSSKNNRKNIIDAYL